MPLTDTVLVLILFTTTVVLGFAVLLMVFYISYLRNVVAAPLTRSRTRLSPRPSPSARRALASGASGRSSFSASTTASGSPSSG